MTFQMLNDDNVIYNDDEETENGNRLMHIACLLSSSIPIPINAENVNRLIHYSSVNARNKNGWTPYFSAAYAGNQKAMIHLSSKCLSTNHTDYFDNVASFYMKQVPVNAIETAKSNH